MYPIMPSLRCTHVSHHTANMVSAVGSDHEITSSCKVGIRVHATTPARHQACENERRPDSDRCRRSGHLSDNDICPTAVILVSDKCRCRTDVAQSSESCGKLLTIAGDIQLSGQKSNGFTRSWVKITFTTLHLPSTNTHNLVDITKLDC